MIVSFLVSRCYFWLLLKRANRFGFLCRIFQCQRCHLCRTLSDVAQLDSIGSVSHIYHENVNALADNLNLWIVKQSDTNDFQFCLVRDR